MESKFKPKLSSAFIGRLIESIGTINPDEPIYLSPKALTLLEHFTVINPGCCVFLLDANTERVLYFSDNLRDIPGLSGLFLTGLEAGGPSLLHFCDQDLEMMNQCRHLCLVQIKKEGMEKDPKQISAILHFKSEGQEEKVGRTRQERVFFSLSDQKSFLEFCTLSPDPEINDSSSGFEIYRLHPEKAELLKSGYIVSGPDFELGKREKEIIALAADGFNAHQTSDLLHISVHTVYQHRKNIMKKLQVNNMAAAISKVYPARAVR